MNTILNRRSIRKYEDKPVEKEKIEKILKAAMQAPSAANQQPWEFLVIENKETLKKLADMSPYSKMVGSAPLAILLMARKEGLIFPDCVPQDMGAAAENLLLEVADLGLGAVWLGVTPMIDRMEFTKKLFDLPDSIQPFALIPIGYPDGQENAFVNRYDETRVHYETWK